MRGGQEHRVAFLPDEQRVLKVVDTLGLATETLHDYLTDIMLSNHFFGDDIQMVGTYDDERGRLQLVTTQPYVDGTHPEWEELKASLVAQGLVDPEPLARAGNFTIHDPLVGEIDVIDLHVNNVIRDASGWLHPIDAHFYFHDRAARVAVLRALGLE